MADKYFVVPAHTVGSLTGYDSTDAAIGAARERVQKDAIPRIVIQISACLRPSPIPRVEVTSYAADGAGHG